MTLRDQLLALRAAARSLDAAGNPEDCLALLKKGSPYDSLFFGEISDPRWLPKLKAAGFFERLPKPIKVDDTLMRYPSHPSLVALKQIGGKDPEAVTQILESLELPNNPVVGDQVLQAIGTIDDRNCIERLAWTVERVLEGKSSTEWLWFDEILAKWHSLGAWKVCLRVLNHALESLLKAAHEERGTRNCWQISTIDEKIVAPIAERHPLQVARFLISTLITRANVERARIRRDPDHLVSGDHADVGPDYDFPSTYWFEDVDSEPLGHHELESTLTRRLLAVGRQMFSSAKRTDRDSLDAMLREDRWHLFRRIRWSLYAHAPSHSLVSARGDALERIPYLGIGRYEHTREFARLLEAHVKVHKGKFLKRKEVQAFFDAVMAGPRSSDGEDPSEQQKTGFQRRQLHPVRSLLIGAATKEFRRLSAGNPALSNDEDASRPHVNGGVVPPVAPRVGEDLATLSDMMLWHTLNVWTPDPGHRFGEGVAREEPVAELGAKFAELLKAQRARFASSTRWWRNLLQPMILQKVLGDATTRINEHQRNGTSVAPPMSKGDWGNWFGVASMILDLTAADAMTDPATRTHTAADSKWSRMVVVQFLSACVSASVTSPVDIMPKVGVLLHKLIVDPDPGLALNGNGKPLWNDWFSTAIHSVRGSAIELLLNLALWQKNHLPAREPEPWIFGLLADRLKKRDESLAVFAICGARLRLVVHLFGSRLAAQPDLLLPEERRDHRAALVTAHIVYDHPAPHVIDAVPELLRAAIECLPEPMDGNGKRRSGKEFESRLGTHLAFYYWNNAFTDAVAIRETIDAFFESASPLGRASTVGEIGRIFAKVEPREKESAMAGRVMSLWDRRFARIAESLKKDQWPADAFNHELGEFLSWFKCECFPFHWRFSRTLNAICLMTQVPRPRALIDTIGKIAADGRQIDEVVTLLVELMSKPSEEYPWEFSGGRLNQILALGFASPQVSTRIDVRKIQESLLRQRCFEYLDFE